MDNLFFVRLRAFLEYELMIIILLCTCELNPAQRCAAALLTRPPRSRPPAGLAVAQSRVLNTLRPYFRLKDTRILWVFLGNNTGCAVVVSTLASNSLLRASPSSNPRSPLPSFQGCTGPPSVIAIHAKNKIMFAGRFISFLVLGFWDINTQDNMRRRHAISRMYSPKHASL